MPSKAPAPGPKTPSKKSPPDNAGTPAADRIDARIAELGDWRGDLLGRLRALILGTSTEIVEEWKWNVPVWSCSGIICTGETYKKAVKLTFPKGASLHDPSHVFNSSLEGKVRRAVDFMEGDPIDEAALCKLVKEATAANKSAAPSAKAKVRA